MQLVYHAPTPLPLAFSESPLESLIAAATKKLKRALTILRGALPWRIGVLRTAYGLGDMPGIFAAVPLDELNAGMREVIRGALIDTIERSGQKTLTARLIPRFDIVNPHVVEWAERRAAEQITLIGNESRAAINEIIRRAVSEGLTAQDAAKEIREFIGLNTRQAIAVDNYRQGLIEQGVKPGRIDELVGKATNRAWRQRAEMIARTEIETAANQGQLEAWKQSMAKGLLDPARTRRIWIANAGACSLCLGMAAASRDNPPTLDGLFTGPTGTVETPPLHVACRCSQGLEFL